MATLLTSPHLAHYDVLMAALPGVLWLRVVSRGKDAGVATEAVRILLAVGFIWLAISPAVADLRARRSEYGHGAGRTRARNHA